MFTLSLDIGCVVVTALFTGSLVDDSGESNVTRASSKRHRSSACSSLRDMVTCARRLQRRRLRLLLDDEFSDDASLALFVSKFR